ncbi:MAG: dihydrolipoyl dehydrogenase [Candidatus Omnitrophica bacterium]|nr:dihydrolipoyl dehydrogenase [Candidatus Omnitrophota bacterium]
MPLSSQIIVIGAGPGGYVAAFRAADLGLQVTLVDKRPHPGGVCLYEGCIPSKALLHAARVLRELETSRNLFTGQELPQLDFNNVRAHKEKTVERLTSGLSALAKQRKINYIQGEARLLGPNTVAIRRTDGAVENITGDKIILATGSRPATIPGLPASPRVWDSSGALALSRLPASLLVIGGGYIGLELGTAFAALGSQVSVVEALPRLLSGADPDLADILQRRLKRQFKSVLTGTRVIQAEETAEGVRVTLKDDKGKESSGTYDQLLVSVGRKPNTEGLGLEHTKIQLTEKGFIKVNGSRQTDEPNIYAIGDLTGDPMLAHKASLEGKVAAEAVAGENAQYSPAVIPAVVFTDPELAWCGLTETSARAQGFDVAVCAFPWSASGRAVSLGRTDGLTRIIAEKSSGKVLGVGIVGIGAGELIAEGALAVAKGLTAADIAGTVHAHPTLSETMAEAAESLSGQATHIFTARR